MYTLWTMDMIYLFRYCSVGMLNNIIFINYFPRDSQQITTHYPFTRNKLKTLRMSFQLPTFEILEKKSYQYFVHILYDFVQLTRKCTRHPFYISEKSNKIVLTSTQSHFRIKFQKFSKIPNEWNGDDVCDN